MVLRIATRLREGDVAFGTRCVEASFLRSLNHQIPNLRQGTQSLYPKGRCFRDLYVAALARDCLGRLASIIL